MTDDRWEEGRWKDGKMERWKKGNDTDESAHEKVGFPEFIDLMYGLDDEGDA